MKTFILCVLLGIGQVTFAQRVKSILTQKDGATDSINSIPTDVMLYRNVFSQTHASQALEKKPLDFEAVDNWEQPDAGKECISPDGKFISYGTFKGTLFGGTGIAGIQKDKTLIVQDLQGSWKRIFLNSEKGVFSADNKKFIFKSDDGIRILMLGGSAHEEFIKGVSSYEVCENEKFSTLVFHLKGMKGLLVLRDLTNGKEKRVENVAGYEYYSKCQLLVYRLKDSGDLFIEDLSQGNTKRVNDIEKYKVSDAGTIVMIQVKKEGLQREVLTWSSAASTLRSFSIVEKGNITDLQVEESGKKILFFVRHPSQLQEIYVCSDERKAILAHSLPPDSGVIVPGSATFSDNLQYVRFDVELKKASPLGTGPQVNVWNYKDMELKTFEMRRPQNERYMMVISLSTGDIVWQESQNEKLEKMAGDYIITKQSKQTDRYWGSDKNDDTIRLVNLRTKSKEILPIPSSRLAWVSPGSKYLVYYSSKAKGHYFSKDLETGKVQKISQGIADYTLAQILRFYPDKQTPNEFLKRDNVAVAGWVPGSDGILVYDNYDIWMLSLNGVRPPVNLTANAGKNEKMIFSFMKSERRQGNEGKFVCNSGDTVFIRAYRETDKFCGFYQIVMGESAKPTKLFLGPYFFAPDASFEAFVTGMSPIRAKGSNTWLLQRQSETDGPNYFATTDFKQFERLTNIQPQKAYNWVTTELHEFKLSDGRITQGVLYKPENFDPTKKYPVIVTFYSELSSFVHQFPAPEYLKHASLFRDPTWMVSHGYLVFMPDIIFRNDGWGGQRFANCRGCCDSSENLKFC